MKLKSTLLTSITIFIAAAMLIIIFSLLDATATTAAPLAPEQPSWDPAEIVTVITVTSGTDPDDSPSKTCYSDPFGPPAPASPCTLRRAMVEASALGETARPILIRFEIPEDEAEGYDPVLDLWKIEIYATGDTLALGRLGGGEVIIDGATQTGGRTSGPKIIIVGPGTGNRDGFVVGDIAGDNGNTISGLGFQNFDVALYVNTNENMIADNWFGLSDDGEGLELRNPENLDDGTGGSGVYLSAGASHNTIQNNVFSGLVEAAVTIKDADHNTVSDNYFGTIWDGTVPDKETSSSLICTEWDWLGGTGLQINNSDHTTIENNIIAGLRMDVTAPTIQPDAIYLSGDYNLLQNNSIGLDAENNVIGVCGRGIYLVSGTEFNELIENTIVNPEYSAISLNDSPTVSTSDANTLRSNIIRKATPWPGKIGDNASPEDAIQLAKNLPDEFENFNPAAITAINGVNVTGVSGADSPCGGCTIEIFLDDTDAITEALQSLAVVTAKDDGSWSATLPAALTAGQGLRTTSTTNDPNVIPGMSDGTTTGLSDLYLAGYKIFIPLVQKQP